MVALFVPRVGVALDALLRRRLGLWRLVPLSLVHSIGHVGVVWACPREPTGGWHGCVDVGQDRGRMGVG